MAETERYALLLSDDFMWTSRITGTAQALGLKVKAARSLDRLEGLAKEAAPSCVIIDLDSSGGAGEVVQRIQAASGAHPRFVAFGSHVDVASLRAARAAGCDPVLPRSQLAQELPALLEAWLT